jgi:RNA polymerase sigma-70 factor (ECF subfamily)
MQLKSDAELMQLVREKHRPALEELYNRYVRLVYSFALKVTGDDQAAKQIVQSVFTRLWTTEAGYQPDKGPFANWLFTITRNIAIDYLRREKRERATTTIKPEQWEQIPADSRSNPAEVVTHKLLREQVQKAYRFLSPSQAELIHSLYWEGYTLGEIARMRSEPIGTIKSRLHQTLKILRHRLTAEMEE